MAWHIAQLNIGRLRAEVDDPLMVLNLSVWESIEALADFAYRSAHTPFLRRRGEWFERLGEAYMVLWWIPAGTVPAVDEALTRLGNLKSSGPSPEAHLPPAVPAPRRPDDHRRRAQHLPGL